MGGSLVHHPPLQRPGKAQSTRMHRLPGLLTVPLLEEISWVVLCFDGERPPTNSAAKVSNPYFSPSQQDKIAYLVYYATLVTSTAIEALIDRTAAI